MSNLTLTSKDNEYNIFDLEDACTIPLDNETKITINDDIVISSITAETKKLGELNNFDENSPFISLNAAQSFLEKMKGMFKLNLNNENDEELKMSQISSEDVSSNDWRGIFIEKIKNLVQIDKSYKNFFITLLIGVGLLCLSLLFILISPIQFVSFFSLGSLFIILSFVFIYGTEDYLKKLFSNERFIFSVLYLSSVLLGFFFAFIKGYFFISLLLALTQFITLVIFVLSFIPGGQSGITLITTMLSSPLTSLFLKNSQDSLSSNNQSYLPK